MATADWIDQRVYSEVLGQSDSCSGETELRNTKDSCQLDMGAVTEQSARTVGAREAVMAKRS